MDGAASIPRKSSIKSLFDDITNVFRPKRKDVKYRSIQHCDYNNADPQAVADISDVSVAPNDCFETNPLLLAQSSTQSFYSAKTLVDSSCDKTIYIDNDASVESIFSNNQSRVLQLLAPLSKTKFFLCDQDYRKNIYRYLRHYEIIIASVDKHYLSNHFFINKDHRLVLFDWMVDVQLKFEFDDIILHKAFSFVDIFLNKTKNFKKDKLQLLALTAIFVACKLQFRHPIQLHRLMACCQNKYKAYEVLAFEHDLVAVLDYKLNIPIAYEYLESWSCISNLNAQFLSLVTYVVECARICCELVWLSPSLLSSASFYLSLKLMNIHYDNEKWDKHIFQLTQYYFEDVVVVARDINLTIKKNLKKMKHVVAKYAHEDYYGVSKFEFFTEKQFDFVNNAS